MNLPVPSVDELRNLSDILELGFEDHDLEGAQRAVAHALASYERVAQLSNPVTVLPRRPAAHRVGPGENPYGGWLYKQQIGPNCDGPLQGMSVVMKDNIAVADVPMTIGSKVLESYVPSFDATIVERVLAAGGSIPGTAACEDLCFSGNSFTSVTGPGRNPYDPTRSCGGSSSGCGVLVALGEADAAIGTDQGGSVRGPAAWSGITGLKPTYGLVPYTGIAAVEMTIDHAGPMARTARDVARLLDVIAGPDGLDPRQDRLFCPSPSGYVDALGGDATGRRIALISEGFGWAGLSEEAVDGPVRQAVRSLKKLGCVIDEISVPWHRDAVHIFAPIMAEGSTATIFRGNGAGTNWRGRYDTELLKAFRDGWHNRPNQISKSAKIQFLVGSYASDLTGGYYYARAQNLVPALRAAYAKVFAAYDFVAMPTLPMSPRVLPAGDLPADEYIAQALDMSCNNCTFNLTGDPSVSIPVGLIDGLPVGLMLTAQAGHDAQLLRFADVLQRELFPVPWPEVATVPQAGGAH